MLRPDPVRRLTAVNNRGRARRIGRTVCVALQTAPTHALPEPLHVLRSNRKFRAATMRP